MLYSGARRGRVVGISYEPGNIKETMRKIRQTYCKFTSAGTIKISIIFNQNSEIFQRIFQNFENFLEIAISH